MSVYNLSAEASLRRSAIIAGSVPTNTLMLDASCYSRVGFRGKNAESFLVSQGVSIPATPNESLMHDGKLVVLRLSKTEFWLVDVTNSQGSLIELLELAAQGEQGVYRLYCQHSHACIELQGERLSQILAKLCAVDMSSVAFPLGGIAQTSVARVNAIVTRQRIENRDSFFIFSDISSSQYLWEAIADACAEFSVE